MKILIVSNQIFEDGRVTNPVLTRMGCSMRKDSRVECVTLMPVSYSFAGLNRVRRAAREVSLVHVHFGGLYALIVWFSLVGVKCAKVITFHGTDIHAKAMKTAKKTLTKLKIKLNQYASFFSILLYDKCGFVAREMKEYVPGCLNKALRKKSFIQYLGVDYSLFQIEDIASAQNKLGIEGGHYVLFSDISGSSIKRRDIAEAIAKELGNTYKLLVMSGVRPNDVPLYINASDFLILTSDEEGSPNIIRECLALNKPVFSVNVGDAEKQLRGLKNSRIIDRNPKLAVKDIMESLAIDYTDNTRVAMRERLDFDCLNKQIIDIYERLAKDYENS